MSNSYTPGPWQLHDPDYCDEEVWGDIEGPIEGQIRGKLVAVVELDNPSWRANAKLIALAPTLLRLCKAVLPIVANQKMSNGYDELPLFPELVAELTAVIRKAEGGVS